MAPPLPLEALPPLTGAGPGPNECWLLSCPGPGPWRGKSSQATEASDGQPENPVSLPASPRGSQAPGVSELKEQNRASACVDGETEAQRKWLPKGHSKSLRTQADTRQFLPCWSLVVSSLVEDIDQQCLRSEWAPSKLSQVGGTCLCKILIVLGL